MKRNVGDLTIPSLCLGLCIGVKLRAASGPSISYCVLTPFTQAELRHHTSSPFPPAVTAPPPQRELATTARKVRTPRLGRRMFLGCPPLPSLVANCRRPKSSSATLQLAEVQFSCTDDHGELTHSFRIAPGVAGGTGLAIRACIPSRGVSGPACFACA